MALSDTAIRAAKPREKSFKIADGKGLFLLVKPSGGKYWRFRFEFHGKSKSLAFGVYPEVSLKDARDLRDTARKDIKAGIDPAQKRKTEKLLRSVNPDETFEAVARDWYSQRIQPLTERYAAQVMRMLEGDVFPKIGSRKISEVTAPEVLAVLRLVEGRGAIVTAHTIKSYCSQIFRFAIALGKANRDVAGDLRGALKIPNRKHFARLEENDLPEFLRKLAAYDGELQTKRALQLLVLTLCSYH